ncbi:MAG: NAD(P)H-binding protein [Nitrosomonadales bacterium]|nr:NAD(P)H-binding protein [Nitrosomonadales bacterium]
MNTRTTPALATIAIFGGSGATGKALISDAVSKGLRVRALARKSGSIDFAPDRVEVLAGSPSNAENVLSAMRGCAAVICVFGPRPPYADIFCESATATIVGAMRQLGIARLICQTGGMIGDYSANRTLPFQWMTDMFKRRSPQVARDREGQENVVKRSGLDWTIVKPPRLTDGKAKGSWQAGPDIRVGMLSSIARGDLADFLVEETLYPQHIGQAVFIRN